MQKVILITGSTDGIGLETAKMLIAQGHHVLIHGRNLSKIADVEKALRAQLGQGKVTSYQADLSSIAEVIRFAETIASEHPKLDALINNAGVYQVPQVATQEDLDIRFVVNTIAPYVLTQKLIQLFAPSGRIVNVASAAQAPVDLNALGRINSANSSGAIYAQSKLALIMWSFSLAEQLGEQGPSVISVNPASFLGSKLVKEAYGMAGGDLKIGASILSQAATSTEFADASGTYFDNDTGAFATPHADALNSSKKHQLVDAIEALIAEKTS